MSVSLGYDTPHAEVRALLREAGLRAELEKPYVQILELGDYAIQYRLAGFLADTSVIDSVRSDLRAAVLDGLSEAKIEIVSPLFVAGRDAGDDPVLPRPSRRGETEVPTAGEGVYDKAEAAERVELARAEVREAEETLAKLKEERGDAEGEAREEFDRRIAAQERRLDDLTQGFERIVEEDPS